MSVAGPPALVAAGAVALLWLLAGVPALLQPCPNSSPGRWGSLARAEADLGVSLWVPAAVPPEVAWPPRRVECMAEAPLTVRVILDLREGSGAVLELTQALGAGPSPPAPSPPGAPTADSPVVLNGEGVLRAERGPDGRTWRQVTWSRGGRRFVLRAPQEAEALLSIARSVGPPSGGREGS